MLLEGNAVGVTAGAINLHRASTRTRRGLEDIKPYFKQVERYEQDFIRGCGGRRLQFSRYMRRGGADHMSGAHTQHVYWKTVMISVAQQLLACMPEREHLKTFYGSYSLKTKQLNRDCKYEIQIITLGLKINSQQEKTIRN